MIVKPRKTPLIRLRFTILFLIVMAVANLLARGPGQDLSDKMLADWGKGHASLSRARSSA